MFDIGTYMVGDGGLVSVDFTKIDQKKSGIESSIHMIMYHLLSDPNSSILKPNEGAGLKTRLLRDASMTDKELAAEAMVSIKKTRDAIVNVDPRNRDSESIITDLVLRSATKVDDRVVVKISIKTMSGDDIGFGITV